MKRILLITLAVLSAVSCKKITPEMRIAQIDRFFDGKEDVYTAKLQQYEGEKQLDYLQLVLAGDLGAGDIWTIEADGLNSLMAEFPGKDEHAQLTMISAPLDDPAACSAVLSLLEAFKDIKIQHKNTIRALFYSPAQDTTGQNGLVAVNDELRASDELIIFDIELSSRDTTALHTFILEENPAFAHQLLEVLPPYFAPLGDYRFEQGIYPNHSWPLKTSIYRYHIDSGDLQKETAAVTALAFLLN